MKPETHSEDYFEYKKLPWYIKDRKFPLPLSYLEEEGMETVSEDDDFLYVEMDILPANLKPDNKTNYSKFSKEEFRKWYEVEKEKERLLMEWIDSFPRYINKVKENVV